MSMMKRLIATAPALLLAACATREPPPPLASLAPPQWYAPLPHNGSLGDLTLWWRTQGDPVLGELVDAAQAASPTMAQAQARIAQARASRVAAGAALVPNFDLALTSQRGSQQSTLPAGTTTQAQLQASWEIDLFGGRRADSEAAQARLAGAQAGWHDARVSVAAEVANQYYALRACEQLAGIAKEDAASRADTSRLTTLTADAGLAAPANAALARASAAEGASRATQQRAQCDMDIKTLVALTAINEPVLRQKLATTTASPAPSIAFDSLPAQTLAQRPDVFAAEREVAAASADVGSAKAARYPRLTLMGSVGKGQFRGDETINGETWTLGPLALTLPIFDGGARRANVASAEARYELAVTNYKASARNAVREVEQALVSVDSAAQRRSDALTMVEGYRAAFRATEDRYKNGLASLLELEDARRTRLAAEIAMINLERERSAAWVSLYRATGGGWKN